jgi:hypothetical protein
MPRFSLSLAFLCLSLGLSLFAVNCSDNPYQVTTPDKEKVTDSIPVPIILIDTTVKFDSANLGALYFNIDFGEILKGHANPDSSSVQALARTGNLPGLAIYKVKHVTSADFTLTDSLNRSAKASYPIDSNGKCSVGIIKVLRGFLYRVRVGFSGQTAYPWLPKDSSILLNEYFSAIDTADLRSKANATLNLVLTENPNTVYFVTIKNPPGKYTEGKKYDYDQQGFKS